MTAIRWIAAARRIVAAAVLTASLVATACDGSVGSVGSAATHRVAVAADGLRLDGQPWWPTGLNAYQLATDWGVNSGCGAEVDLDAFFAAQPVGSLTRFNAFQNLAVNKHTGALDFTAVDAVFEAAERHRRMVIPVLAGQDGACDDDVFKQRDWYTGGWREKKGLPLSHRDWVATAVQRWSGSRAIAAWEPVGEPEPSVCAHGECSLASRTCPADSAQVLRAWTDEVGRMIRRLDPGRLITAGVIGGHQCGIGGVGYGLLAESPFVDVLQYHDYDHAQLLPERLELVDKPILVAELGIDAGSCRSTADRAEAVGARLDHYRELGAAGAMLWAFVPDPRPGECRMDIGPDDPVLARPEMLPGKR